MEDLHQDTPFVTVIIFYRFTNGGVLKIFIYYFFDGFDVNCPAIAANTSIISDP